ncbi:GIY-YIG nuclease family protein [Candidatus Dependentiae bacterium]|nr:GIY-YIG nuclease family protein [Candidatus Dependentiae bacterium]
MYFFVYILKCSDGSYYTGHTDDLEKRIAEHRGGRFDCYTLSRRPIKLVYAQHCSSRHEALSAEQKIKTWSRKKKEALIENNWQKLSALAKKNFDK